MELLKKNGIISLLLIFIMTMIGCGNKAPKNIDEEIYNKSVEMLAYTERCFNNDTETTDELYGEYEKWTRELCEKQNRERTEEEKEVIRRIVGAGWELHRYKVLNVQIALDDYKKCVKEAKELLNIPANKDSNEVWDKIKEK